jgi:hypothetical protein
MVEETFTRDDNGRQQEYTIQVFSLQVQHVKCIAKHIENELYIA